MICAYRAPCTVSPVRVSKRPKKERKTKKETIQWQRQTGYSPRPHTSSGLNQILHGGWFSGDNNTKFRSGFRDVWSNSHKGYI